MNLKILGFSNKAGFVALHVCFAAGILFLASLGMSNPSCSAAPETPCDPEYMDALESRAWLEAQREISQNQSLIFKPDSVLEYTCFDHFLNEAASNWADNDRQFSETHRWDGPPEGFSDVSTDEALTFVVLQPMLTYLATNFAQWDGPPVGAYLDHRVDEEYIPQDAVDGAVPYTCEQMALVWHLARCMNFQDEPATDGFFEFNTYAALDPRRERPEYFVCPIAEMLYNDKSMIAAFADTMRTAYNEDQALFMLPAPGNEPFDDAAPYLEDDIVTHFDLIFPVGCNLAVPTGVVVNRPDLGTYDEHVCTNPGCSATPGGACTP